MDTQFVIAGFGGQGIMLMGQILAKAAMEEDKNVSWLPSYGPEMRGGEANCSVVINTEAIGSPLINEPQVVVAMNLPSMQKFEQSIAKGGLLLYNCSIIEAKPKRDDIKVISVPCNQIAKDLKNEKVANMVMLGALLGATKVVSIDSVMNALADMLGKNRAHLLPLNNVALEKGIAVSQVF